MAQDSTIPSHAALEAAAEWFALLRSSDATEQDRDAWRLWLNTGNDHREAWTFVDMVSRRFEAFRDPHEQHAAVSTLQSVNAPRDTTRGITRRQTLNGFVALAGAGLLGWGSSHLSRRGDFFASLFPDYRTATGEIRALTLADGTHLWLNTATTLNVYYYADLRRLQLIAGEVLIETAKDVGSPFIVDTPHGRLRALGTRFSVRLLETSTRRSVTKLAVTEGAVEVRTADGAAAHVVRAGRELHFDRLNIAAETPASNASTAWISGVLLAEDMPLHELLEELNRYHPGYFSVAPTVAELRVLGGFPVRDTAKVFAMLEQTLPVTVHHRLPWWTSIEPRKIEAQQGEPQKP